MRVAVAVLVSLLGYFWSSSVEAQNLSPPAVLPGDAAHADAAGRQQKPHIARGSPGYLVVWEDNRSSLANAGINGPYFGRELGSMFDIYAARLDPSGALLDSTPIVISQAPYNQTYPHVAWNGTNWLVVWMTEREGDRYYYDVMAVRVSPSGEILDPTPIVIDQAAGTDQHIVWDVTSDGANWTVIWRDLDDIVFTIDGARIAPDGTVIDVGGKRIRRPEWNRSPFNAELAFAGDSYLVVFEELDDSGSWQIKGQRLSTALDPVGSTFPISLYSPAKPSYPSVASDGTDYLVAWFEDRYYGWAELRGSRVSHAGAVLDPAGIMLTPTANYTQFHPDIVWGGTYYFVAHNYLDGIYVTRVATTGVVVDATPKLVRDGTDPEDQVAITAGVSGGAQLAWNDSTERNDIHAASVTSSAVAATSVAVSVGAPRQSRPRAASSGGEFLVVFRSETSLSNRILAHRVATNGEALTVEPIEVASGATLTNPSVAWNGSNYYVVWESPLEGVRGRIYGRRLNVDGTTAGPPAVLMDGNMPDVAAIGSVFLAVCTYEPVNHNRYTRGVRVGGDGVVIGSPFAIGMNYDVWPRVTPAGTRWLVVWEQNVTHDNPWSRIVGAFVDAAGTPGANFDISDGGYDDTPHVSRGSSSSLVVWAEGDIFGRRILDDGTLLDPPFGFVVTSAPEKQWTPTAAWDGLEWTVDYLDHRNEAYPAQAHGDISATTVAANGIAGGDFAVAASPLPEETPTIAADSAALLFAWSALVNGDPHGNMRITVRTNAACCDDPGTLALDNASVSFVESSAAASVTVTRSGGTSGEVSATASSSDGTATAPSDYAAVNATVTFADGESGSKSVPLTLVGDSSDEPDETFNVTLSSPTGGATLGNATSVVTILDDDTTPLTVESISPDSVPSSGGSIITITGTGFQTGVTLQVGSLDVEVTATTSTNIGAILPALPPGSLYDVVVTNPDATTASLPRALFVHFLDVAPPNPFLPFIETMVRNALSAGCGGGNYCPDAPLTRAQLAVFLLGAKYGSAWLPSPATGEVFADVAATDFAAGWIEQLYAEGITAGCGIAPLRYCPTSTVTRQQIAVFLLRARNGNGYVPPPATGVFDDVAPESLFAPWIERLHAEGITAGCSTDPPLYCPALPNTRGQMAVFLVQTFQLP